MFWLFCKKDRQWSNIPSSMFKNIWTLCSLPAWSGNLCITFFLISFLMVLSKQNKKKNKKQNKKKKEGPAKLQFNKSWFYRGSWTMHKLGSRLVFSSWVVYLAKQTFLRVIASHCHYMRSIYLMYICSRMYIKYMCVRACVRVCAPDSFPCCRLASSCRKTDILKLGMEVKTLFLFFVDFFFDLFFWIKDVCNSEIKKQVCGF